MANPRSLRRIVAFLTTLALLGSCTTAGGPSAGSGSLLPATPSRVTASSPPAEPAIGTILSTLDVPGDGEVLFGRGSIWVEDRVNEVLNQIDLENGKVAGQIPGVLGGYMDIAAPPGDAVIWMSSFVLDAVLRIDVSTGAVSSFDTGPGQAGTTGVVLVGHDVWVANHYTGTLARITDDGKVAETIDVTEPGEDGAQAMTTDGTYIWVSIPRDRSIAQVDPETGTVVRKIDLDAPACGSLAYGAARVWVTNGGCEDSTELTEVDAESGRVVRTVDVGASSGRVTVAFGAVWVPTFSNELARIDPDTGAVSGRLSLPGESFSIAASETSVWVRLIDSLIEVRPT